MSFHDDSVNELDQPQKRRIQRRHGACEPCRSSKTKCDGREPCGACRSERRRQSPCVYSEKARKLRLVTAEIQRRAESEKRHGDEGSESLHQDETNQSLCNDVRDYTLQSAVSDETESMSMSWSGHEQARSEADTNSVRMSHPISVCATIEEFKRLRPARGYSAQVVSRCSGFEVLEKYTSSHQTQSLAQISVSSSKSPCRSSDPLQEPIELQQLRTKLVTVDDLIRDGQLKKAWIDLASIVREAQSYQDATVHDHSSTTPASWGRLWTDILDLEARVGLTIGQPTCLIPIKKAHSKVKHDTVLLEDSLEETRIDLYQHVQGILGLDLNSAAATRDFLERAQKIINHEPFNQVGLCTTQGHSAAVRDLHLNTHLLFLVVFSRMASLCDSLSHDLTNGSWSNSPAADIIRSLSLHQTRQKSTYCRRMFRSANFVLDSFIQLHEDDADQTGKNWIRCHGAYIAGLILGIAKLRHEVEWHATTEKLHRLEQIFSKQSFRYPHCQLFSLAVDRLQDVGSVKEPASEAMRNRHTGVKVRKQVAPSGSQTGPGEADHLAFGIRTDTASKRSIDMVDDPTSHHRLPRERFEHGCSPIDDENQQPPTLQSSYDQHLGPLAFLQDNSATYGTSTASNTSFTTTTSEESSATSVSEPDMALHGVNGINLNHPGPPFAYPFPYHTYHPPMTWNNTTYPVHVDDHARISLQVPTVSPFGQDTSPLEHGAAGSFSFSDSMTVKSSTMNSSQSSPLGTPIERTAMGVSISPNLQVTLGLQHSTRDLVTVLNDDAGARVLLRQMKGPLECDGLSEGLYTPSGQDHPTNTIRQSSPPECEVRDPALTEWQLAPTIALSREVQSSLPNDDLPATDLGRRASADDRRQMHTTSQRLEQSSFYPHSINQSTSELLSHQVFHPDQAGYMATGSGIFEPHQLHGHYVHGTLSYPNHYISGSGQFLEQWRRTVDTGEHAGNPFQS